MQRRLPLQWEAGKGGGGSDEFDAEGAGSAGARDRRAEENHGETKAGEARLLAQLWWCCLA